MANLHNVRIQYLYDSETNWQSKSNVVSVLGEAYVYVDSEGLCSVKFGDGQTTIGALEFSLETAPLQVIEDMPYMTGTFTYDGTEQTPTWYYYDPNKMTMSGSTSGVNAGTYYVVLTPKEGYCWSDGTVSSKTITWEIQKAAPDVLISDSSISLPHMNNTYYTVTVTFPTEAYNAGDCVFSEGGSEFGCNYEINASEGRASFTIYMTDETQSSSCTVGLSLTNMSGGNYNDFYVELPVEYVLSSKSLEEYTWSEIASISANGEAPSTFEIGDTKTVILNGEITVGEEWGYEGSANLSNCEWEVFIAGFTPEGHILFGGFKQGGEFTCLTDMYLIDGNGVFRKQPYSIQGDAHYTFAQTMLHDALGGAASALDPTPNSLMAAFPYAVREYMRLIRTYHSACLDTQNISTSLSVDLEDTYLTIPSAYEVFGERNYEGALNVGINVDDTEDSYPALNLSFFRNGNRAFYPWEGASEPNASWSLRSSALGPGYAYYNGMLESEDYDDGTTSFGVIPIFCI